MKIETKTPTPPCFGPKAQSFPFPLLPFWPSSAPSSPRPSPARRGPVLSPWPSKPRPSFPSLPRFGKDLITGQPGSRNRPKLARSSPFPFLPHGPLPPFGPVQQEAQGTATQPSARAPFSLPFFH